MAQVSNIIIGESEKAMECRMPIKSSIFPVGRLHRYLKQGAYAPRISRSSAAYLGGVFDYLLKELLEEGGKVTKATKTKRVTPKHLLRACQMDGDMASLLNGVFFSQAGEVSKMPMGARTPAKRRMVKNKRKKAMKKKMPMRKRLSQKNKKQKRKSTKRRNMGC